MRACLRARKAAIAPLVRRHRKLPWIPTEEEASIATRSSMMERTTAHEQSCSGMNREVPVIAVSQPDKPLADYSVRG